MKQNIFVIVLILIGILIFQNPIYTKEEKSILDRLMTFFGITANPTMLKDDSVIERGDIWIVSLAKGSTPRQLTFNEFYRTPVFTPNGDSILTLKNEKLLKIPIKNPKASIVLCTLPNVTKLISFHTTSKNELLVLAYSPDNKIAPGVVYVDSGKYALLPNNNKIDQGKYQRFLHYLRSWERVYKDGKLKIYPKTLSKRSFSGNIEWTEIFIEIDKKPPRQLTQCDKANCNQAVLSHDLLQAVYVCSPLNH